MILQNDFKQRWQVIEKNVLATVQRVGASGWYILGEEVESFEVALTRSWGVRHAVGVGNGMDALEIGLRCLALQPGGKVLTTPLSAFATTLAIVRAGGVPVFVDVDALGRINLVQCRKLLQQDPSIRFFVPVHLFGFALDMDELARLKADFELSIVEDCAQAIGASDRGISVGTAGQICATSFYPTKNLGALGDGGALLTNNDQLATTAKALRNYGQSSLYVHAEIGLNSRLDEIQAAILKSVLLPRLETWTEARRKTAQAYLAGIRHPLIRILLPDSGMRPVWHLFPVVIAERMRDNLREHLRAAGILTGVHYPHIIPDQVALAKHGRYEVAIEPVNAREFARSELSLPIHPFLKNEEIDAVIDACNAWKP